MRAKEGQIIGTEVTVKTVKINIFLDIVEKKVLVFFLSNDFTNGNENSAIVKHRHIYRQTYRQIKIQ